MTEPDASAHIDVAASPDRVYALVSDLPGLARLSEEFVRGAWLGQDTGPRVGARFKAANRRGVRRWSTVCTVTDASPARFAFDVRSLGLAVARWQYDIEPTDGGCRVTESSWDRRPGWFRPITAVATGVADRSTTNRGNIEKTLARLKLAAEA